MNKWEEETQMMDALWGSKETEKQVQALKFVLKLVDNKDNEKMVDFAKLALCQLFDTGSSHTSNATLVSEIEQRQRVLGLSEHWGNESE